MKLQIFGLQLFVNVREVLHRRYKLTKCAVACVGKFK